MSLSRLITDVTGQDKLGTHAALPGVPIASPRDEVQASELLKLATRDSLPFVILGKGSKLGWSVLHGQPAFGLSTAQMCGVLEFEPGDGVLTALAGTAMDELERVAGEAGLAVTPSIARPAHATLGGVIGAGQSGLDRDCRGAGRLHILGTDTLQLDGVRTRSGGRLVKNVSGYDMHRLMAGSFGSLALVLEASLRLFPLPEEVCVLTQSDDGLDALLEVLPRLRMAGCAPHTLLLENISATGNWNLQLVLAGRAAPLDVERKKAEEALDANSSVVGDEARERLRDLRDLQPDSAERDVIHIGARASEFGTTLHALFDALGPHAGAALVAHPSIATIDMGLEPGTLSAGRLQQLRDALKPLGAQVTLQRGSPLGIEFTRGAANPVRDALQTRLRKIYDPKGLLCTRPPLGAGQ